MNDQSWTGEHLIRAPRNPNADSKPKAEPITRKARTAKRAAEQTARRENVAALHGRGLNGAQIARELGCAKSTVCYDLKSLGLEVKK